MNYKRISILLLLFVFAANAYAADFYIKIDGIKGERARIVRCADGTCAIEGLAPGSFTVTVCDSKGNALKSDNFKLSMTFTPAAIRESPTMASTGKGVVTGVTPGTSGVTATRDVSTGQSSGKRQHGSIRIVKEWDAASPQLKVETPTEGDNASVVRWVLEVRVDRIEMK